MKKTLALILSALMLISMLSVTAFAGTGNLWGTMPAGNDIDLGPNGSVAVRFATASNLTAGTSRLTGLTVAAAGTVGAKFTVKAYTWQYNYDYTVSQEPIAVVSDITLTEGTFKRYPVNFETPLPINGDYLFVLCDVTIPEGGWAVKQFTYTDTSDKAGSVKVYYDGKVTNGALGWQFIFEEGGWTASAVLPADEASPVTTDATTTTAATTTEAPTTDGAGTAGSSDNAGDSADTSDNALVATLAAVAVMGLAVACVAKKKQH